MRYVVVKRTDIVTDPSGINYDTAAYAVIDTAVNGVIDWYYTPDAASVIAQWKNDHEESVAS